MKSKIILFLVVVFFAPAAPAHGTLAAQEAPAASVSTTPQAAQPPVLKVRDVKGAEVKASGTLPAPAAPSADGNAGGATLPPEKAAPVRVARFERAPVIDGKLD